jgi:hypothetical protein
LSDRLPEPRPLARIEVRQEQPAAFATDVLDLSNMRPWCRVCGAPVAEFGYTRYADGFYGFHVRCHGQMMGGLIPYLAPQYGLVLEVFCDGDPKVREGRWFWVGCDGAVVQYSQRYNVETAVTAAFSGPFGKFARKYGQIIGMAPMMLILLGTILWKLW